MPICIPADQRAGEEPRRPPAPVGARRRRRRHEAARPDGAAVKARARGSPSRSTRRRGRSAARGRTPPRAGHARDQDRVRRRGDPVSMTPSRRAAHPPRSGAPFSPSARSTCSTLSPPERANRSATSRWSRARMFTPDRVTRKEPWVGERALADAEQDERRIERHARERVHREARGGRPLRASSRSSRRSDTCGERRGAPRPQPRPLPPREARSRSG